MRLLYDAVLPQSLAHEAPEGVELERWSGADVADTDLVRTAAERGCRGVILLGRESLEQPDLRNAAREVGVALIATVTDNPIEAKRRILNNISALRQNLPDHDCLLIFAADVRPDPPPDGSGHRLT